MATDPTNQQSKVSFTRMSDGSKQDFDLIVENDRITAQDLPDRIIEHLKLMALDDAAYRINRLEHALQAATRCERDGADDDWIIGTLIHDIGDTLAPYTHAEVAYEILRPFVKEEVAWVVKHHGIFQKYYYKNLPPEVRQSREAFKDHPYYQLAVDFCEKWDQVSFDPDYDTYPLEHFIPLIQRTFSGTPKYI